MIVYFLISLSLIAVLPALTALFYLPHSIEELVLVIRWPLLFVMAVTGLEILYYFGPSRPRVKWRWMSYGSFTATLLWVVSSSFFSLFVSHFGKYNETYGSLGAVIILLFWFWLSALTILLGAEINATLEQPDKPVTPTG